MAAIAGNTVTSGGGLADSGVNLGDTGGVKGPSIAGDSSSLGAATKITKTVTVTRFGPTVPQLHITVGISNPQGPLYTCPVQGAFQVGDSFGAPRYAGGFHPHAGNDIFADEGTPIAAPFDGTAENAANGLGGNAVIVRGAEGYVYNAHLSAYGTLGPVKAGDIIGYVGNTGDALGTAYHDHFEWHPYNQQPFILNGQPWVSSYGYLTIDSGTTPAVDPYPFLEQACPHE